MIAFRIVFSIRGEQQLSGIFKAPDPVDVASLSAIFDVFNALGLADGATFAVAMIDQEHKAVVSARLRELWEKARAQQ